MFASICKIKINENITGLTAFLWLIRPRNTNSCYLLTVHNHYCPSQLFDIKLILGVLVQLNFVFKGSLKSKMKVKATIIITSDCRILSCIVIKIIMLYK